MIFNRGLYFPYTNYITIKQFFLLLKHFYPFLVTLILLNTHRASNFLVTCYSSYKQLYPHPQERKKKRNRQNELQKKKKKQLTLLKTPKAVHPKVFFTTYCY